MSSELPVSTSVQKPKQQSSPFLFCILIFFALVLVGFIIAFILIAVNQGTKPSQTNVPSKPIFQKRPAEANEAVRLRLPTSNEKTVHKSPDEFSSSHNGNAVQYAATEQLQDATFPIKTSTAATLDKEISTNPALFARKAVKNEKQQFSSAENSLMTSAIDVDDNSNDDKARSSSTTAAVTAVDAASGVSAPSSYNSNSNVRPIPVFTGGRTPEKTTVRLYEKSNDEKGSTAIEPDLKVRLPMLVPKNAGMKGFLSDVDNSATASEDSVEEDILEHSYESGSSPDYKEKVNSFGIQRKSEALQRVSTSSFLTATAEYGAKGGSNVPSSENTAFVTPETVMSYFEFKKFLNSVAASTKSPKAEFIPSNTTAVAPSGENLEKHNSFGIPVNSNLATSQQVCIPFFH
ncbi:unnamed protein product [Enterobius vermicularis]|uniref:Uncharacterized protein n=1 Tax=Enterobius vermicularis TaxID=51028 RepID=A0A0N4V6M0_ENTVE|nr:unnamed protein product [Enterobius vermicularis]